MRWPTADRLLIRPAGEPACVAVFERSTVIRAPLDRVWEFHSSADGLVAVTPDWLNLRVEGVVGPDGEPAEVLNEGTEVSLSIRPFGIGPRQSWTSRITGRTSGEDHAAFTDEMLDGPFPRWVHTHRFDRVRAGTELTDRVEYQLPLGPARGLSAVGWPGFVAVFADRHRRTRRLLE